MKPQPIRAFNYAPIFNDIFLRVCREFDVTTQLILTKCRLPHINDARASAMWLCAQLTRASRRVIGAHFNRDHSTVSHALRRMEYLRETEPQFRAALDMLAEKLADEFQNNSQCNT